MHGPCLQGSTDSGSYRTACDGRPLRGLTSGSRDVDPLEHLVQQRRLAAATDRIEGVLQTVVEEISRVQRNRIVEFPAHGSNVAPVHGQLLPDVSSHCQRQILNVRRRIVGVIRRQAHGSVLNWNRLQRLDRDRHRDNARKLREIEILQPCSSTKSGVVGASGRVSERSVDRLEPAASRDIR